MSCIDARKEAVTRVHTLVDTYDTANSYQPDSDTEELTDWQLHCKKAKLIAYENNSSSWSFGSPMSWITPEEIPDQASKTSVYHGFNQKLRGFIKTHMILSLEEREPIKVSASIKFDCIVHILQQIHPHKTLYLRYQSMENWKESCNYLRCNPSFHGRQHYDCTLINYSSNELAFGHIRGLYACHVHGKTWAVAYLTKFKESKWKPDTKWARCRVYKEELLGQFFAAKYLVQGTHMIPTFDKWKPHIHYLNDTIDGDWFLHAGN